MECHNTFQDNKLSVKEYGGKRDSVWLYKYLENPFQNYKHPSSSRYKQLLAHWNFTKSLSTEELKAIVHLLRTDSFVRVDPRIIE